LLLGGGAARPAAARAPEANAIVTEGYMDVIALHRAGFATAVAPLGTALTEAQLAELWRLSPEPVLCFDGDPAGRQAAGRALRRALPLLQPGRSLRFAALPAGEDPDSLIRAAGGEGFAEVLAAARPLSDMIWQSAVEARPADTPERRADLRRRLDETVAAIDDREVREEYRHYLRERFFAEFRRGASRRLRGAMEPAPGAPPPPPRSYGRVQREILFRLLLHYPDLVEEVAEELAALALPEPELDRLRRAILGIAASHPGLDARTFQQHLLSHGFAAIVEPLLLSSVDTGFLVRCVDPISVRREWTHRISMLTTGDRNGFTEAAQELGSNLSEQSWERFRAEWERLLEEHQPRDVDPPTDRI
jgi:DNA primase